MKRFSFSLEAVLTLRAREEESAAQTWAEALQAQVKAEKALDMAKQTLEDYLTLLEQLRLGRFQPADQQVYLGAVSAQNLLCDQLSEALLKAIQTTAKQHALYLHARMRHEMLLRLKVKRHADYQKKAMTEDQALLQDLTIARHSKRSDYL
jgi:hypothetical protein